MATSIGKDVQGFFVRLAGIGNPDDGPNHHFVGLGRIGSPSHYIQDGMGKLPEAPLPHRLTGKSVAGFVSSLKGLAQDLYLLFRRKKFEIDTIFTDNEKRIPPHPGKKRLSGGILRKIILMATDRSTIFHNP